jgi:site-specific DNA-cytosine methylase
MQPWYNQPTRRCTYIRLIPSKVICVEIDETAREVADFANPKTPTFPGSIHEFYDVNAMTPEWIREHANSITLVCISMPCKDMTTLTLQKPRNESDRRREEAENADQALMEFLEN